MRVASPAKINWLLNVLGRRADGFHEIETIFQTIDLTDHLDFERADSFSLSSDDPSLPKGERNLVYRAWKEVHDLAGCPPVRVHIEKRIPAGGGLGGGSSNAAATILALEQIFSLGLRSDERQQIAARLGSDVPFFLEGGTCYGRGRGEILERLPSMADGTLLLVIPDERISTAEAYERLARPIGEIPAIGYARANEIAARGVGPSAEELTNDFEAVVFSELPVLRDYRDRLLDCGAGWARMSGSGSTIVGWFAEESIREFAESVMGAVVRVEVAAPTDAGG